MPTKVENRITFLVVFAVLVGAADDAGDVHALPLEVDRLRGLLEPLAHDLEGRLAELGLDLRGGGGIHMVALAGSVPLSDIAQSKV